METSNRSGSSASPPGQQVNAAAPGQVSAATLAKGALRRLVMAQLEPTPENYTRAYQEESGQSVKVSLPAPVLVLIERLMNESLESVPPSTQAKFVQALNGARWVEASHLLDDFIPRAREHRATSEAVLIEQLVGGLERNSRHWTPARKKDSLLRVLSGSRTDANHLQTRVRQLVNGWDDQPQERGSEHGALKAESRTAGTMQNAGDGAAHGGPASAAAVGVVSAAASSDSGDMLPIWNRLLTTLGAAAGGGLPLDDERSSALAAEITAITARIASEGPNEAMAIELDVLGERTQKILQHRHQMLSQLGTLCHELTASMSDLAEDSSWVSGQCEAMKVKLDEGLTPRGVRAVSGMLKITRARQGELRAEREAARHALRGLMTHMLHELDELGSHTGRFHESVGRYADVIEQADSLASLANVVRDMASESRDVKALMSETQSRLNTEHENATALNAKVSQLESELRRLSEEVSTDQLTQIANRRGLHMAFAAEKARAERTGKTLAIGLIDVDDFKRLNDKLGHGAGDEALKALAATVRDGLRPTDTVARYGGEEFVVMLPETEVEDAVTVLTRLQRSLTRGLFMHNDQQVFVTFSAGVSAYRPGEPLEQTLDRSDEALYEAKRTGKNRTCIS